MFEAVHEQLNEVSPAGKGRGELETVIGELSRVEAHAAERRLAFTAAIDDLDDGGINAETVTRVKAHRSLTAARVASATAAQLKNMPRTREALARGAICEEHAGAAAKAAEATTPAQADELAGDAERQPADRFARQARSWTNRREHENRKKAREDRQRAAREARMWVNADGMICLYAQLDPIEGQNLRAAFQREVDRLWHDDGGRDGKPDDVRTPDHRGADAIARLLTATAASTNPVGANRPHPKYQVFVRADADRLRHDRPRGTAEFIDGTALSQTTLERIACDAAFTGAIFDTNGAVLWQGRSRRIATDDQWTALIGRDGGCVICNTEPAHCQAHHLDPWAPPTRGQTDIDRLALVCSRDHHLIHDHHHTLTRHTDGTWHLKPPKTRQTRQRAPDAAAA